MPRGWPQFGGAGGGGVVTDSTLTGSGTIASPLSVAAAVRGSTLPGFNFIGFSSVGANYKANPNATAMFGLVLPALSLSEGFVLDIDVTDAVGLYDFGLYNSSGVLVISTGAHTLPSGGIQSLAWAGTLPVSLTAGMYYIGITGTANTAVWWGAANDPGNPICPAQTNAATGGATTGGTLNASGVTPPAYAPTVFGYPCFALF